MQTVLLGIAALLLIGMAAQWIAWRLGIPSILLLLIFGYLAGPGRIHPDIDPGITSLFREDLLFAIVSASVAVILFEGGLSLKLSELRQHGRVTLRLITIGALVTWVLGAVSAHYLAGFAWDMAILIGAVLIVSGPTVVLPLLRTINPKGRVGSILKWEGIGIDPIGAVIAVLVYESLDKGVGFAAGHGVLGIVKTVIIGGLGGLIGGLSLVQLLKRYWIPDYLHNPITLAMVVIVFAATNAGQHESGLLAVTVMGVVATNQASVSVRHILEFKENLRVLLISGLFILLAARLETEALQAIDAGALAFLAALLFVVRPASVLVSTWGSTLSRKEKIFLAWLCPRGIVAAAVASVFALDLDVGLHPDAARLVPITFLVIVGTVVVYGLTAGPLARRMGLAISNPQGILFVGAHEWARAMAKALQKEGIPVFLVDVNRRNVNAARMAELPAVHGDALSEHVAERSAFAELGRVMALTLNDEVNTLTAMHYVHHFGRSEVYQLVRDTVPSKNKRSQPSDLRGRSLFAPDADYYEMSARLARGRIATTTLSEQFDYEAFQARHGDRALALFAISTSGNLTIQTVEKPLQPGPGDKLVAIVDKSPPGASDEPEVGSTTEV